MIEVASIFMFEVALLEVYRVMYRRGVIFGYRRRKREVVLDLRSFHFGFELDDGNNAGESGGSISEDIISSILI